MRKAAQGEALYQLIASLLMGRVLVAQEVIPCNLLVKDCLEQYLNCKQSGKRWVLMDSQRLRQSVQHSWITFQVGRKFLEEGHCPIQLLGHPSYHQELVVVIFKAELVVEHQAFLPLRQASLQWQLLHTYPAPHLLLMLLYGK